MVMYRFWSDIFGGQVVGDVIPTDVGWLGLRTQRESYKDQPKRVPGLIQDENQNAAERR